MVHLSTLWYRKVNNRDWNIPDGIVLWPVFEAVIIKSVESWDVMKMAVEGGWCDGDGDIEMVRIMDDLCANFAEKFKARKLVEIEEVVKFLIEEMDETFNAEIESSAAVPPARVMVAIYEEMSRGCNTGMLSIFGEETFAAIINRGTPLQPVEDASDQANDNNMEEEQEEGESVQGPMIDEDGFETVVRRRKPNKAKKAVAEEDEDMET